MDPRRDTENLEATEIEDDDELDLEDDEELEDYDDEDDLDEEDDQEAELSQAELPNNGRDTERELDHGLKETFPASDPVSINPGAD